MNREVPFDPEEICDNCGAKGAYDFMGDCLCGNCVGAQPPQTIASKAALTDQGAGEVWAWGYAYAGTVDNRSVYMDRRAIGPESAELGCYEVPLYTRPPAAQGAGEAEPGAYLEYLNGKIVDAVLPDMRENNMEYSYEPLFRHPAPSAWRPIYCVPTDDGSYTHHDKPVPLADQFVLYAPLPAPPAQTEEGE